MHTHAHTRHKCARARFIATKRARSCLCLVCAHVCTNLYEKSFDNSLLSCEYKSQISLRSELSLRRYSQNNTVNCLILNFQCIMHFFTVLPLKSLQMWIFTDWLWNFLETRYKNGLGNKGRWHHFKLTGYLLTNVVTWYFPKIINKHPVHLYKYIT